MPVYAVKFYFKRVITCHLEAEDERDIDAFMVENPAFNPVEDAPEIIDEDETGIDEDSEQGDYDLVEVDCSANFMITPGLELREIE